jgi:hypothetical protein
MTILFAGAQVFLPAFTRLADAQGVADPRVAPKAGNFRQDRILVQPKPGVTLRQMEDVHGRMGAAVIKTLADSDNLQVVRVPGGLSVPDVIEHYLQSELVEAAEPDYIVHTSVLPNDSFVPARNGR